MMKVRLLLLVQGLLLAACCDGRARNPVLEEELKDTQDYGGWDDGDRTSHEARHGTDPHGQSLDVSGTVYYPSEYANAGTSHGHASLGMSEGTADASAEMGTHGTPARTGNWCAFVHKRVVTTAVSCGTEKYTIKSQSPCPNGTPDCQLVMYKLSTRPVYREKQKIFTALLWRCCPGHGGENCDETVAGGHVSEPEDSSTSGRLHPGGPEIQHAGSERVIHNQNEEQNDHDDPSRSLYLSSRENQTEEHSYDHPHSQHDGREYHYERVDSYGADDERTEPPPEAPHSNPGLIPIHNLKEIIMSHLQPVLDGFNLTLESLSQEVRGLQRDMAYLQLQHELERESEVEGGGGGEELQQHEDKLTDTFQHLEELRMQLSLQRDEMEERLHGQQTMLLYNLTNLKTDMDVKIKRNQKILQTNLQSLNSSLSELRQEQERLEEELQIVQTSERTIPSQAPPQEDTAVWEAITRLDNKVVNNTVELSVLNEDQVKMSQNIKHLQKVSKNLGDLIFQTDRKNEDRYIEAFLEVDGLKTEVQNIVDDKVSNITTVLQEMEEDINYLFKQFYKNISSDSRNCDCTALSTSVAQLKQDVADVIVVANENRLALDSAAEERIDSWRDGDWRPSVDDLKLGLQNVQSSLAFEQEKSRTLKQKVTMLHASLSGSQQDIEALQSQNRTMVIEINRLASSFNSLLNDAVSHTKVLEILLGEEVLEFMDWPVQDKEAHSIPALKDSIRDMQEQINRHSKSLASMLNSASSRDTVADEPSVPSEWTSMDLKRIRRHQRFDRLPEKLPDYSDADFLALEKTVEQLREKILKLEEQRCPSCCNCTKGAAPGDMQVKLQAELTKMHKDLKEHLRIFSSIFTNTDGLAGSEATVDLDKLSALMKRKDTKQQRKRQKKRADGGVEQSGEHKLRSKRDASLETAVLSQLPDSPLMFLASRRDGVNISGTVVFETVSLNRGQMYSPKTGAFRAPTAGVYLFVLTLDFGPGPSLAQLKRGEEVAASLHQSQKKPAGPATRVCLLQLEQGEELQLEIVQGTLEPSNPQDNTFAGLLILQTT
ncbi:multimerin-2a isoform X2 [Colossoma macropomum]|uniref:multimerin-2a isoform X2 n=1 Tax=Colossoma macropomum TaxID=42526 RepID=UPI0018652CF6|nr:multimerin-2a isoform X2 [Colossoma macropomum]